MATWAVPDRPPGSSQRRHLTVMFCDVVGSTRLSERHDVEETFVLLNAYYEVCRTVVERHGGVIVQHLGDGIYAWFGYPQPRDDDAARAVWAALDLLATFRDLSARLEPELGEPLGARIGVHAGEALVAPVEQTGVLTAYGFTPNLAAKLQQHARPGTVVVSDAVCQLLRGEVEFADIGALDVGDDARVRVYEVLGTQHRDGRVGTVWRGGLVGRDAERDRLRRLWERRGDGEGAVVALVGARGIGKTRLAADLLSLAGRERAVVLDCACGHLHANTPYRSFRTLLAQAAGLEQDHAAPVGTGLLRAHLVGALGMPAVSVTVLGHLLGLPKEEVGPVPDLDPAKLARLTSELLVDWLTRLAARPTAVLIDDVTDADPSTLTVLEVLLDALPPHLLLVLTVRSDATVPALLGHPAVSTIPLSPLPAHACETLVDALSGGGLDETTRARLLRQGDGVPLFLEELVRAARDPGGSGLPITLTGHLEARLLAPRVDREIAGALAAADEGISAPVLASVIDTGSAELNRRLAGLIETDLVVRTGGPGSRYGFRHRLIAEAAYGLLLRSERARLHGRLADALVEQRQQVGDRVDWDVVGRHLKLAHRPLEAFEAILTGADEAGRAGSYREALRGYSDALDVLAAVGDPATRDMLEIRCRVARGGTATAAGGFGSDDAAREFDRGAELCRRLGPSSEHLSAIVGMLSFYVTRGEPSKGRRVCDEVRRWVESGAEEYRADHALLVGIVDFFSGDYRAAAERIGLAAEEFARRPRERGAGTGWLLPYDPTVIAVMYHGVLHWIAGRPDEGRGALDRAASLAGGIGFPVGPFSLAYVHSYQAWVRGLTGDLVGAFEHVSECHAIGRRHGFRFWESLGEAQTELANHRLTGRPEALEQVDRRLADWKGLGGLGFLPYYLTAIAQVRAEMGHPDAASRFDSAGQLARDTGLFFYHAESLRLRALTLPLPEERCHALLKAAWEVAHRQGAWLFELRAALELARRTGEALWMTRLAHLTAGRGAVAEFPEINGARAVLAATGR